MALGIPTSNILQPGNISLTGGVTRQLVSDLQLLTPQYYKNYVEKYGSEDFTWWLSTYAGMEEVKNRDYFWFENRGKLITGVQAAVLDALQQPQVDVLGQHRGAGLPTRGRELRCRRRHVQRPSLATISCAKAT